MIQDSDPKSRALLMAVRQALLMMVDALEVFLGLERTSALRKRAKHE